MERQIGRCLSKSYYVPGTVGGARFYLRAANETDTCPTLCIFLSNDPQEKERDK